MSGDFKNVGEELENLRRLKQKKADINQTLKDVNAEIEEQTDRILAFCEDNGLQNLKHDGFSVSVGEDILPTIDDFDVFWKWMRDNDHPEMLQKRISTKPFRELVEHGEEVPGLSVFKKAKLSTRNT